MNTALTEKNQNAGEEKDTLMFMPSDEVKNICDQLLNSCGNGRLLHLGPADLGITHYFLAHGVQFSNACINSGVYNYCSSQMHDRFYQWDGLTLPFADGQFNTVLVTKLPDGQSISVELAHEILRVSNNSVFLYLEPNEPWEAKAHRRYCETQFLKAGARKHAAYFRINDYQALQDEQGKFTIPLEKLPAMAFEEYPFAELGSDPRTDMTRHSGDISDAHIVRYMLASRYVRAGDRILDAASGKGYGAHVLLQCSEGSSVVGIDSSNADIKYSDHNFSMAAGKISFRQGELLEALAEIPDNSIDFITSFETLEFTIDPETLLAQFYRVLTPSGRIVLSAPNGWTAEPLNTSMPSHSYTWKSIAEVAGRHFLIESAFAQTATRYRSGDQWKDAPRQLTQVQGQDIAINGPDCEWCLLVGMKNPLEGAKVAYEETTYDLYPENPEWRATRFEDYENPWLVKGLVTIGHRLTSEKLLTELSTEVARNSGNSSPDMGAALCILGYQTLSKQATRRHDVDTFEAQCKDYLNTVAKTPQQLRWQVSLCYLLAQIFQKWGDADKAISSYTSCVSFNCSTYSPTLITKQVHSFLNLGIIKSGLGDTKSASAYWKQGVECAEAALALDWNTAYGSLASPNDFGIHELGAIVECAASCAYALRYIDNSIHRTPQWWHQLSRDRASQLSLLGPAYAEISRLNELLIAKENIIGTLVQNTTQQDILLNQLGQELERMGHEIQQVGQEKIRLELLIGELNQPNAQKIRIRRWRDAIAQRPITFRAVAKVLFLTASLLTPASLRNGLRGPVKKLIQFYRSHSAASEGRSERSNGQSAYLVKQPTNPDLDRPVVIHIIANFLTGGSSRLVVDIFEHLGTKYDQRIVTSYAPNPPAYIGIPVDEIRLPHDTAPFVELYKNINPAFIHMHYWGDCDEPWYAQAVLAAEILGIPIIQNINTPVLPFYSTAIKSYVYVSDYVKRVFGKADNSHVTVYPGSDFSLFESKAERKSDEDCIGMVYRLEKDKLNSESIMPFILAAQQRPSLKVLIVGGGSLLDEYVSATTKAGVGDNFEFMGYVPYEMLPSIYERMKIFVAPVWKESFGQVSPFAMNMRVPVVGFDIGAIGEIVQDPTLLAPPGDSRALADIIVSLLDDTPRRVEISERHRRRARDYFSIEAMITSYKKIYHDIMVTKNK